MFAQRCRCNSESCDVMSGWLRTDTMIRMNVDAWYATKVEGWPGDGKMKRIAHNNQTNPTQPWD